MQRDERELIANGPRSMGEMRSWMRAVLEVEVLEQGTVEGHAAPLAYLWHAFDESARLRDCVVWASRGSGKTFYAAAATLLDLLYKPGIDVRLLGGSLEQSSRVYEHLRRMLEMPLVPGRISGRATEKRVRLDNGSSVEILAQSQTSVRGVRPQKLRCDEAELFDPAVWTAAQLTTRSKRCGGVMVRASIEALSTWHRPGGLMAELVASAGSGDGSARRLFRWGTLDVLEQCENARACDVCVLEPECRGIAKRRDGGHLAIDDATALKLRVDSATWESEMLCLRPSRSDAVFAEFDRGRHVGEFEVGVDPGAVWVAGMDFGFRAPTVVLWACLGSDGVLRVVNERVSAGVVLEEHVKALLEGRWPRPVWVGIDPAGHQRSGQTGRSDAAVLQAAGLRVRSRRMSVQEGLRCVRARLAPAAGLPRLLVHARCEKLIESLERYHYPAERPESVEPVKDGQDHAADALRYLVMNLDRAYRGWVERYA